MFSGGRDVRVRVPFRSSIVAFKLSTWRRYEYGSVQNVNAPSASSS